MNARDGRYPAARAAVVLAGGQSRRMGGADKALIELEGRSMIERVLSTLAPQVDALLISANRHLDRYRTFGYTVLDDGDGLYRGPLAGMARALAVVEHDAEALFCCPCDSPFLQPELIQRLFQAHAQADMPVVAAHDGERLQPVFAVLSPKIRPALEAALGDGERKIDRCYAALGYEAVDCADLIDSFININDAEELAAAAARMRSSTL